LVAIKDLSGTIAYLASDRPSFLRDESVGGTVTCS